RLILQDETSESLASRLAFECISQGLFTSEAGLFFGGHAMQSDNIMKTLSLLNILWDGGDYSVGRKNSPTFLLSGARLTASFLIQKATLLTFIEKSEGLVRGSGFLSRFLIAYPASTQGTRLYKEPTEQPYFDKLNEILLNCLSSTVFESDGQINLVTLEMSKDAKQIWVDYYNSIEKELGVSGDFSEVSDIASKNAENAARISAIFHVIQQGVCGVISAKDMESATKIAYWYLYEAKKFLRELVISDYDSHLLKLDAWIIDRCKSSLDSKIYIRELLQFGPYYFRKKKKLEEPLKYLEDLSRIKIFGNYIEVNPLLI
ncbi:MAG TPA: hypothetical protein DCM31_03765, partial [Deferribacteraceae bacterium]|nr:hypothetical protein [Deferribacteraceae bacterium]